MRRMTLFAVLAVLILTIFAVSVPALAGSPYWWTIDLAPAATIAGMTFDVQQGYTDRYYDQELVDTSGDSGGVILLYRENGPTWSGPTGLYHIAYGAPIEPGQSITWSNIYLWSQGYTPPGNLIEVRSGPVPLGGAPPDGYRATVVLDHVPDSLNYTGSLTFEIDPTHGNYIYLPVPVFTGVPDPLHDDITRMHLTVYAPVPEPSSLAALALGLAPLAVGLRRKR